MNASILRAVTGPLLTLVLASGAVVTGSPAHALADRDCGDFASQKAAQIFFLQQGGPSSDPHRLDSEGDGIACETNPAPYYYEKTLPTGTTTTTSTALPAQIRQRARVTKVVDGDTIDVRLRSGKVKRVRLIGIDTPEVYGGVECGGKKASASMRRMAPVGSRVVLLSDPTQDRADRYGRLLRYVVKAGQDLNRAQVARGWATVYVFDNDPFRRVSPYRRAQRAANNRDRGIWGLCR